MGVEHYTVVSWWRPHLAGQEVEHVKVVAEHVVEYPTRDLEVPAPPRQQAVRCANAVCCTLYASMHLCALTSFFSECLGTLLIRPLFLLRGPYHTPAVPTHPRRQPCCMLHCNPSAPQRRFGVVPRAALDDARCADRTGLELRHTTLWQRAAVHSQQAG